MQIVTLDADGAAGVGVVPTYSYAAPTVTSSSPSVVAVASNLAATTTRFTVAGAQLGAEDASPCTTAPSVPSMSIGVTFSPADASYAAPVGGRRRRMKGAREAAGVCCRAG